MDLLQIYSWFYGDLKLNLKHMRMHVHLNNVSCISCHAVLSLLDTTLFKKNQVFALILLQEIERLSYLDMQDTFSFCCVFASQSQCEGINSGVTTATAAPENAFNDEESTKLFRNNTFYFTSSINL
nr:hypothetical protein Iba_chr11cCG2820 [Ipomoea batatas]GMD81117.1 hypothetical protein Iba_chr13eCG8480 [Ipomoea batatas]